MPPKDAGRAAGKFRFKKGGSQESRTRSEETVRDLYRLLPDSIAALQQLSRDDLRALARERGLKGWSRLRKKELQESLTPLLAGARRRSAKKAREAKRDGVTARRKPGPAEREIGSSSLPDFPEAEEALPESYGITRIVLLPIDPYRIHAYWDLAPEDATGPANGEGPPPRRILRVYDVTYREFDGTNAHGSFDIEITPGAGNWYIDLWSPQKSLCAELGTVLPDGTFHPLARSNIVHTAAAWVSPKREERWMGVSRGDDGLPGKEAGAEFGGRDPAAKPASGSREAVSPRRDFPQQEIPSRRGVFRPGRGEPAGEASRAVASERTAAPAPGPTELREGIEPEAYRRFLGGDARLSPGADSRRNPELPGRSVPPEDRPLSRDPSRGEGRSNLPAPKTRALAVALEGFEPGRSSRSSGKAERKSGVSPYELLPEFSREQEEKEKAR